MAKQKVVSKTKEINQAKTGHEEIVRVRKRIKPLAGIVGATAPGHARWNMNPPAKPGGSY